jgi:hypothetical protein
LAFNFLEQPVPYSDAALMEWARGWLEIYDDGLPDKGKYNLQITATVLRRFIELAEAERIRKGRPPSARGTRKYSVPALVSWCHQWLENPFRDNTTTTVVLRRFIKLVDAERIHKERPAHRPRGRRLGEMVEAQMARGLKLAEARRTVARETGATPKAITQAHRRLQKQRE